VFSYADWIAVPSARHLKGCNFSFADGHAERHRWQEENTLLPVRRLLFGSLTSTGGQKRDLQWLTEHATALP
jgi:prepilin-type processing-associated H-X9-DG protein